MFQESSNSYLIQAKRKFHGAETCFLYSNKVKSDVDVKEGNAAASLCLAVELGLKSLYMYYNESEPPRHHNLKDILDKTPARIPEKSRELILELNGMYTLVRYDSEFGDVEDIDEKLTQGNKFLKYVEDEI